MFPVVCPACGTADSVRSVENIQSAAARLGRNGGSMPYVVLLAQTIQAPSPPQPPPVPEPPSPPPSPDPPMGIDPMTAQMRLYRRHLVRIAAIFIPVYSFWLSAALVASATHPSGPDHLTVGDFWGSSVSIAVFVALIYAGVVAIRREWIRRSWTTQYNAYRRALDAARWKAGARAAAAAAALELARAAMASAYYCHQCDGCFWPAPPGRDIPALEVLAPGRFREALAQAGGYPELADRYYRI
jgi:hypothetical protein